MGASLQLRRCRRPSTVSVVLGRDDLVVRDLDEMAIPKLLAKANPPPLVGW